MRRRANVPLGKSQIFVPIFLFHSLLPMSKNCVFYRRITEPFPAAYERSETRHSENHNTDRETATARWIRGRNPLRKRGRTRDYANKKLRSSARIDFCIDGAPRGRVTVYQCAAETMEYDRRPHFYSGSRSSRGKSEKLVQGEAGQK